MRSSKLKLSWDEYLDGIRQLIGKVSLSSKVYNEVMGVSRGGLIPGLMISHAFKLPFRPVQVGKGVPEWLKEKSKTALIVDDLVDTGNTKMD